MVSLIVGGIDFATGNEDGILINIIIYLGCWILGPAAFVYSGAMIAPSYRKIVAITLSSIQIICFLSLAYLIFATDSFSWDLFDGTWQTVLSVILSIISSIVSVKYFWEDFETVSS